MAKAFLNGNEIFGNVHLGEGGDVANPNIADVYDPTQTYNTGDRRIYNDVLYVCNEDNVTGAWDSTKWDSATIDEIISALTADDIPYSSGVSVADKLDSLTTVKNVSSSVTKYTNIDYFEKSVIRSGNVVCVYISFSFSSTPTANNIIAENLPKAAANMLLLCECTSGSNNGKAARVMVNSSGRVLDWYTTGFFGTGMNYSIIGSYITNDPI